MNARYKQAPRTPPTNNSDWRWKAVVARDREADGKFIYSVKTTGVYCRPSCPSRVAKRNNVVFHKTPAAAEAAGFRPCKRCKPGNPLFKSITGRTAKKYALTHRADRFRSQLRRGRTVTEAIFDARDNSGGRFYQPSHALRGMTPSTGRVRDKNTDIWFAIGQCSLGSILVAKSHKGVCAILLGDHREALVRDLQDRFPKANLVVGEKDFEKLLSKVLGLVETPHTGLDLPLDIRGTAFQQRVWKALRKIPVGSTASYTDIARRIGSPKSVRAVAQACGANAIAVAIPCHRVVRHDDAVSGYRWGIERKRSLLEREAAAS